LAACGTSNDDGGGNPTGPSGTPNIGATVTITASGVSPQQVRIQSGEVVRFVNSDGVTHVPSSNPHPTHTDCPGINSVGALQPGASANSSPMDTSRSCGFHDHNNPTDARFAGQILIGNAQAEPGPGYLFGGD
jgi:plastocyanin